LQRLADQTISSQPPGKATISWPKEDVHGNYCVKSAVTLSTVTNKAAEGLEAIMARPLAPFECDGFRCRDHDAYVGHGESSPLMIVGESAADTICDHDDLQSFFAEFQSRLLHTDMRLDTRQHNLLRVAAWVFRC